MTAGWSHIGDEGRKMNVKEEYDGWRMFFLELWRGIYTTKSEAEMQRSFLSSTCFENTVDTLSSTTRVSTTLCKLAFRVASGMHKVTTGKRRDTVKACTRQG